jgi:hypothetical protein
LFNIILHLRTHWFGLNESENKMRNLKQKLAEILHLLPSRAHASVFIDALKEVRYNFDKENHPQHASVNEVMVEVVGVLENWIESNNYRYADPTDNHTKGQLDDAIGETCEIFKSFGFYY